MMKETTKIVVTKNGNQIYESRYKQLEKYREEHRAELAEKARQKREQLRQDPVKYEEFKAKQRERYHQNKKKLAVCDGTNCGCPNHTK